jgi:hypothetical protein
MHQAVINHWHEFSEPLEGRVPHMYLDIIGLVTCGVGNLIDASRAGSKSPWSPALALPWTLEDGTRATREQVIGDWQRLKSQPALAKLHYKFAGKVTVCRLTDQAIDDLVLSKLREFERELVKHFPGWDGFPADAQLGICSMAWAVGPAFAIKFTNFARAVNAGDWLGAQASCKIREQGNPGVVPRNARNRHCFENAARVVALDMPRDVLHWPGFAASPLAAP